MDDVFARAGDEKKEASNYQDRKRPLYFRAVIAEPKKRERNNHRGTSRAKGEPGQFPFMRKSVSTFRGSIHFCCSLPGSARTLAWNDGRPRRQLWCI